MQELENEKQRAQFETAEKIKKLLADTIEFSMKTAQANKRKSIGSIGDISEEQEGGEKSSIEGGSGHHVIRNLVGGPSEKKHEKVT
jgi:hypothetical protein